MLMHIMNSLSVFSFITSIPPTLYKKRVCFGSNVMRGFDFLNSKRQEVEPKTEETPFGY